MGNLHLVRHGQASFGADDYDQLSDMGTRQSVQLGRYFAAKGFQFDAVLTGTLRRHTQTLAGISEGMGLPLSAMHWPGLNEYDSEAVIAAVHPEPLDRTPSDDNYRQHERVLLVSSGGPIACAVGHVLGTPPDATVELNMRLRNSAVTEFTFTPKRYALQTYNTLNHLDGLEFADWVTHA